MTLVDNNLRHFPPDAWKCLLLGNAQRSDYPSSRCDVSVHPHTMWGEILHINSPRIKEYDCERIMLVLDDVNLQGLNVAKLIHFADRRKADMVSPRVLGATHPWMYDTTAIQSFNTGNLSNMRTRPWFDPFGLLWGKTGHEQWHLEIFATLFNSRRAWPVFEKLLAMVRPGYGWGYDWCMGKHLKQFIDASQTVSHAGQPKGPKSENGLGAQIEMKALQEEFDIIMAGCDSAVAGIAGRAV
jgi:hypothetical protein